MSTKARPPTSGSTEDLVQDQFDRALKEVEAEAKDAAREALRRRIVAYGFKIGAGIGGIAVSANAPHANLIGVAILIVVFLDAVFSNHEKLLVAVEGRNAYRRVLRSVRAQHDAGIVPVVQANQQGDKAKASSLLIDLCPRLKAWLESEADAIRKSLEDADVAALRRISLDDSKANGKKLPP